MPNEMDKERYSLCIAYSELRPNGSRLFMYYRVADYNPSKPSILVPPKIEIDHSRPYGQGDYPEYLYNPKIKDEFDSRDSDFYLLQWRPSPDEPGKQLTRVYDYSSIFPIGNEPKEVIVIDGIEDEISLRKILRLGFPCPGLTTDKFYLAYKADADSYLAIRCERSEFEREHQMLKLRDRKLNMRGAISVPQVRIKKNDVIWSLHSDTGRRGIHAKLNELVPNSQFVPWPLADFAGEYVRWFIRQEESVSLSRTDRQRIAGVIRQALDRPDMLDQYLGQSANTAEVDEFRDAVLIYAQEQDDPSREEICSALIKDSRIHDECVRLVMAETEAELADRQRQIEALKEKAVTTREQLDKEYDSRKQELETQIEAALNNLKEAEEQLETTREECESISRETLTEQKRLSDTRAECDRALIEIESNIALKLGLRAAASVSPSQQEGMLALQNQIEVIDGSGIGSASPVEYLDEAVAKNLSRLGVFSLYGSSDEARTVAAQSLVASMACKAILAIPRPLAKCVADALSVALESKSATYISIPTDYRGVGNVLERLPTSGVVCIDNVIDPVNESILFALLQADTATTIILPFTSFGSAKLMAREAWDQLFYPPVEGLAVMPAKGKRLTLYTSDERPDLSDYDIDEIALSARDLSEQMDGLSLPFSSFLLPAMVKLLLEDWYDLESGIPAIGQHLAMASGLEGDAYEALTTFIPDDYGLAQLAIRLCAHGI